MAGVRRIWGILKSTTVNAISGTMRKLTRVNKELSVVRRFKELNEKSQW